MFWNLIDQIALYIGYAVLLMALFYAITKIIDFDINKQYMYGSIFGFGLVYVRNQDGADSISKLKRRDIGNERWFIDAPEWFNRTVYNFGVAPEDK